MIKYDASFIKDIDASPKFISEMIVRMNDSIEDLLDDFVFQIATDYCEPPECEKCEDAMHEQIIAPLRDRIYRQILLSMLSGELNA